MTRRLIIPRRRIKQNTNHNAKLRNILIQKTKNPNNVKKNKTADKNNTKNNKKTNDNNSMKKKKHA